MKKIRPGAEDKPLIEFVMKGSKYSKLTRPRSWKGMIRSRRNVIGRRSTKLDYNTVTLLMLVGMSGLIIMLYRVAYQGYPGPVPNTPDWDKQRAMWLDQHPSLRPLEGERPRILMVTGSSPQPCDSAVVNHGILQSAKNKVDYCRLHDIQLYYSMGNPNRSPEFSARFGRDWWVTLPIIRMLMLQHPEVEWMWWVDADAVFTDMSLEPPFADLKDHNLVLFRENPRVKTRIHTGNYLMRNCQWTLDLIRLWESASTTSGDYNLTSTEPSDFVPDKKLQDTFDARKLMVTSLLPTVASQQQENVRHKVIETETWTVVAPHLEELQVKLQQKQEHGELPLVTHFAGCMKCRTGALARDGQLSPTTEDQSENVCLQQLDRTFDFADNQIYDLYGFQRRALGSSKMEPLTKYVTETWAAAAANGSVQEFSMLPRVTIWDELRNAHFHEKFAMPGTNEKLMLVSGSAPKPCGQAVGDQIMVRGLKNKIDYCRLHGIEIFYDMAVVDKDLTGWWSKLPLLRMLMLKNPEVEWFWWIDTDTVVTDMDFQIPFERYRGYNLVMYGEEKLLYEERTYTAIRTGNFFIRNCQWSIDLLDKWASHATSLEVRWKLGEVLSDFLERPANWEADDQSVLVYILITERERWSTKVKLENKDVDMSATWTYWTPRFLDSAPLAYKPFATHFSGCTPCGSSVDEKCLTAMDRALNFADNQVLESAGYCHEHLGSPDILSDCSIRSHVM